LAAYSMISAGPSTLAMHRLVQAVTRTPDPEDPHRDPQAIDAARDQAARQLAVAVPDPDDPARWPSWWMLLPHIDVLASHAPPDAATPLTPASRNNLAYAHREAGDQGGAIPLLEQVLADYTRVLGADHPDTLGSRNNLAGAYLDAEDLARAIPLYEQT